MIDGEFVSLAYRGKDFSDPSSTMLRMSCEPPFPVRPCPWMKVRIPVMAARGAWRESSGGRSLRLPYLLFPARRRKRHESGRLSLQRTNPLPLVYHFSLDSGEGDSPLPPTADTKSVRKAVTAVMVTAMFAAMNCQYAIHTMSNALTVRPVEIPATRITVQMMVSMVRHKVNAKASF